MIVVGGGDIEVVAAHGARQAAAQLPGDPVAARHHVAQGRQRAGRAEHIALAHAGAAGNARASVDVDGADAASAVATAVAEGEVRQGRVARLQQDIERHRPFAGDARAVIEDDALLDPVANRQQRDLHAPPARAGAGSSPMVAR